MNFFLYAVFSKSSNNNASFFLTLKVTYLTIVFEHSQKIDTVHYASLMEFPRDAEELFQLFFHHVIEHSRIDHVGRETLGVLRESKIGKPFGAYPGVAELCDARISHKTRMSVLLDGQSKFLPMKRMSHTQTSFQFSVI